MTEQLREKIVRLKHDKFGCGSYKCPHWQKDCYNYDWVIYGGLCPEMLDQLLVLIKEAGLLFPITDISLLSKEELTRFEQSAKTYLETIRQEARVGYVKLVDVVKWSGELCPHSWGKYPNLGSKKGCQRCWEELEQSGGKERLRRRLK